ncbi:NUDIX domain-containing protein [Peribacillus deserti]|uniref:DNA mismatch repair protein MutT n=1 Tax=Peribacillus deserti TaxID=673318 RepID=A0A2N5M3B5_9BACI|nr:NUDIX domain-containing protein [Peribacillus deserti]PLT28859.1 DNA mismatch repair protein MutT [Peribacillus deserti]
MRNRGSAIVIENQKVALIRREWNQCIYYVFPGGGVERGESPEAAAEREAYEELGVTIRIRQLFETAEYNGTQYFYLAEITGGTFGEGEGEEFNENGQGTYQPEWVDISSLMSLDVRPEIVSGKIVDLFQTLNLNNTENG